MDLASTSNMQRASHTVSVPLQEQNATCRIVASVGSSTH